MTLPPWRTLAIAAGGVVAIVLLGAGAWMWSAAQQQRGAAAYASALLTNRASDNAQTSPEARESLMRELERVLAEYPSNAMAPQASYLLGNLRFASGQYDRSRAAYQLTVARAGTGT